MCSAQKFITSAEPMEPPPRQELKHCLLPRCLPPILIHPTSLKDCHHLDFYGKFFLAFPDSFDISKQYSLGQFMLWDLCKSYYTAGPLLDLASCI